VIPGVRHSTAINNVLEAGRLKLRQGLSRALSTATIHEDAAFRRSPSPFESCREFIDRDADRSGQVTGQVLEFRADVDDEVDCFTTETGRTCGTFLHDLPSPMWR
jgi:hypothetical protein